MGRILSPEHPPGSAFFTLRFPEWVTPRTRTMHGYKYARTREWDRNDTVAGGSALDRWQRHWEQKGKTFSDSAELIREDRDSR
jgi:hypothetical protein